ncbi:hypothetical protein JVU11DRAFT_2188 [Chiua virens]|nr:hypothetical protein JVU11DRAFT_2188 [Chiua virens]
MASATAAALRQFTFFDVEPVKDVHDPANPPERFKNAPEISTMISSSHGLVVADIHGSVHLLNQAFVSVASWVAHVGGRVTHMVEEMGILVSIGDEDNMRSSILKIWDLGKTDKRTGGPFLLRTAKVQPTGKPHPVTTLALTSDISFLSIGLADGSVLLYRHLDQSLKSSSSSASIPKPRVIHEIATEPVTFLAFITAPSSVSMDPLSSPIIADPSNLASTALANIPSTLSLIIVTTSSTYVYPLLPKPSSPTAVLVDEIGAGLRCACVDWKARWVVLGRDEAAVGVGSGGRLGVVSYEGRKSSLYTHLNYVVVVLPGSTAPSATLPSAATRTPGPRQRKLTTDASSLSNVLASNSANGASDPDAARVVLIDMENKMVAYFGVFERGVRDVVSVWGSVYVLGNDGTVTRLSEKPTGTKLALLYEKHLYSLALSFAYTQSLDTTDVHRHHGDYLYEKGDYEGAMKEYLQTIGGVRGSYVVRKFLTANLTPLLMLYLQELHTHGLANAEHTTLLLNTYAKVGDVAKVDAFVRSEGRVTGTAAFDGKAVPGEGTSREPPFDLDTAIRRWGRHEDYLRVVVEDIGAGSGDLKVAEKPDKGKIENGYREAVSYLREVGGAAAESNLARYCRALLDNLPNETTQLLIDLCTISGPLPPLETLPTASTRAPAVPPTMTGSDGAGKKVEDKEGEEDLVTALAGGPSTQSLAPHARPASGPGTQTPPRRPSPMLFFAHFVDHPGCFTKFLETMALRRWGQTLDETGGLESGASAVAAGEDEETEKRDQAAVWNTLLELYLDEGTEGDRQKPCEHHRAYRLLHSTHLPYDLTHALVLCSSHRYTPGLILLWEKMGMYEDVLRFWMEEHNSGSTSFTETSPSAQVISALRKYGPDNPHLFPLVLRFLTSTPALLTAHQTDLESLLEHIESEKIMSPLSVVQVLSRNEVASVGLVKGWLMRRIKEGMEEIATDQQLISSYRSETKAKLKQVEDLEDTEHPRVFHVTRCSQCNGQLDLPSIHFMCNHSYHQRCLFENETACPSLYASTRRYPRDQTEQ